MTSQTVALISATPLSIEPARAALQAHLPSYHPWNILDDRLLVDAEEQGAVTESLHHRMNTLIDHALDGGAAAILLTCSLYGFVTAEYAGSPVPVLPPDQAAFEDLLSSNAPQILVIGSLNSAVKDSSERLREYARGLGEERTIKAVAVPEAMRYAKGADPQALARILTPAALQASPDSAIFLAQYSLSPAAPKLSHRLGRKVFSGPDSAASALSRSLAVM